MITLYSYPQLFGLEDNNPYGLKVFAFLTMNALSFEHRHVLDTSDAPRGQLPYLDDEGDIIGDSDAIIAHLKHRYRLPLKRYVLTQESLVNHCTAMRKRMFSAL